eukprot:GHVQ01023850.1.p1 GENE.GHVQ01023850.1~~GHVQ01023850.1.p1  ORF type:complete len:352 (+),score=50.32 GHVQ01023850.1:297-1352(+)
MANSRLWSSVIGGRIASLHRYCEKLQVSPGTSAVSCRTDAPCRNVCVAFTRSGTTTGFADSESDSFIQSRFPLHNPHQPFHSNYSRRTHSRAMSTKQSRQRHDGDSCISNKEEKHRGRVLVVGCNGALGRALCTAFTTCRRRVSFNEAGGKTSLVNEETKTSLCSEKHRGTDIVWDVVGCDVGRDGGPERIDNLSGTCEEFDYVGLDVAKSLDEQADCIRRHLGEDIRDLDAAICVSGGFAAGGCGSTSFLRDVDWMLYSSAVSSAVTAAVASSHLKSSGLLVLPGASAALGGTPNMVAYGAAKAYVHHLVASLSGANSGLPEGCRVIGVAPVTLDTPANRNAMPAADTNR